MPRQQSSTRKRAPSRIARKDTVHPFDEKVVPETDRTVPVEPVKQSRKARQPMPEPRSSVEHCRYPGRGQLRYCRLVEGDLAAAATG